VILNIKYLPNLIIRIEDSAATIAVDIAPIKKKTKRKMSSLQEFWDIINKDYPEIIDMIIDYNEKEVTLKDEDSIFLDGVENDLSVIYSWPPVLPIAKYSTTFNSEDGAYYIKLSLF